MAANENVVTRLSGAALALPAAGAETVVLTSTPNTYANPGGQGNVITGTLFLTPGTSSTTATVRVRQQNLAGVLVDASPALTVVAAAPIALSYTFLDASAAATNTSPNPAIVPPATLQYVVTVQTNSTVAGSAYGTVEVTAGTTAS